MPSRLSRPIALLLFPSLIAFQLAPAARALPVVGEPEPIALAQHFYAPLDRPREESFLPLTDPALAPGQESVGEPGSPARALMMPAVAWMDGGVERIVGADGEPLVNARLMGGEYSALMDLVKRVTPQQLWQGSFLLPVRAPISTPFGLYRVYGPSLAGPHLGVDLAGRAGAAVVAANSGLVVFAGPWDLRGNSVIIDHGLGVFSGYYHLHEMRVTQGRTVTRGDIIGAVGATGLATGPHAHWDMIVRGRHVSPLEWVDHEEAGPFGKDAADWPIIADVPEAPMNHTITDMLNAEAERAALAAAETEALLVLDRASTVQRVYAEMLGRLPEDLREEELHLWVKSDLPSDQLPFEILAAGIEERTRAVRKAYVDLLGRDPLQGDPEGLATWVNSGLPLPEIRTRILADGGPERTAAIRRLYSTLLGRDPINGDAIALQAWVEGGLGLGEIRRILSESPEAQRRTTTQAPAPLPRP